MSVLVGYGPEARGRGGLELARELSLSADLPLIVCCVIPDPWRAFLPSSDGEPAPVEHDRRVAAPALARAAAALRPRSPDDAPGGALDVTYEVITARSAPAGLLSVAQRHGARVLVTGSSTDGRWGHIALGSVTDRLLHSSPIPVAIAPRGYHTRPGQRVERITVAVDGSEATQTVLEGAAAVAGQVGARLRVVTFAVRAGTMYPPEIGLHVEDEVVEAWRAEATRTTSKALGTLESDVRAHAEAIIAEAPSWGEALDEPDWAPGDVLVVGSSQDQPLLSRVFVGSTAARIIRHSPVPVIVVP